MNGLSEVIGDGQVRGFLPARSDGLHGDAIDQRFNDLALNIPFQWPFHRFFQSLEQAFGACQFADRLAPLRFGGGDCR